MKDKLKLKPTLKEKRHYIVIEVSSSEKLQESKAKDYIDCAILDFIGKLGYASAGPLYFGFYDLSENKKFKLNKRDKLKDFNENINDKDIRCKCKDFNEDLAFGKSKFQDDLTYKKDYRFKYIVIVSVLTKYIDYIKSSLTLSAPAGARLSCVGVSGTLKKVQRFLK
jgi:RNase P/RNase MRP subunit POP5